VHFITDNHQSEDQQSFSAAWLNHERALSGRVRSKVRNSADQEDVLQAIALEAWKGYPTMRDPSRFSAWCGAIAARHITRHNQRLNDIRAHETQTDTLEDASGAL
jgi:DNA-directed RNA polymerase specialized sigma24 family protein